VVHLLEELQLLVKTLEVLGIVQGDGDSEERQVAHSLVNLLNGVLESEGRPTKSIQVEVNHHVVVLLEAVGLQRLL
jgi:hypothetical protein